MTEQNLTVGDLVRHADSAGDSGVIQSFPYHPYATVRWESTGRESTENFYYLIKVDA